jgi:hypothetical protein
VELIIIVELTIIVNGDVCVSNDHSNPLFILIYLMLIKLILAELQIVSPEIFFAGSDNLSDQI